MTSVGTSGTDTGEEAPREVVGAEPEGRTLVSCIAGIGKAGAREPGAVDEVGADIECKSDAVGADPRGKPLVLFGAGLVQRFVMMVQRQGRQHRLQAPNRGQVVRMHLPWRSHSVAHHYALVLHSIAAHEH
jgi:hypothetical protein